LAASGIPTRAADLNLSSIGVEAVAGSTTVTRTVTSVADRRTSFEAKVQAPAGYRVTVTPSRITLAPGASATFTVTITNTGSAPAGQWRTGALTWRGDGYEVHSPIAVKGTTLSAPTSVPELAPRIGVLALQFGFAGPYTATAEGLLAAARSQNHRSGRTRPTQP
jgi:hypothetical protein